MSTPAHAPYKEAQRAAELALRESRRALRVDRAKLVAATALAAAELRHARAYADEVPPAQRDRLSARLRSLWAALTRRERLTLTGRA